MRTPLLHASLGIASVFSFASLALAQSALTNTPSTEDVTLKLGDIFEIIPSTDIDNADTSWILTQDRTFVQADRTNVFRYRFIEPKTYQLIGSVQSPDHSRNVQRTFRITVEPRDESGSGSTASLATGTASVLVTSDPILNLQGKVVLPDGKQTVKLIPANLDVKPLALDIDLSRDSDGNGSPSDDLDDDGTYFHSDATPLYVWLTKLQTEQGMSVTASGPNGATKQDIDVLTEEFARTQGLFVSPISFAVNPLSSSEFDFVSSVDASVSSPSLVFQWDFGDGSDSLLTNPRHAYGVTGDFTVTLKVRDLKTGADIGSFTMPVNVESVSDGTSSAASSEESSVSSEPSTDNNPGAGFLSMFAGWIPYAVLLILSLLLGALGVFVFGRLRRKKPISDTFATMEAKILDQPSATAKNPPPLAIKKTVATPSPAPAPVAKADISVAPAAPKSAQQAPAPAPTPAPKAEVVTENAPDWLKKGMAPQTTSAPTPAPAAPKPAPAPTPAVPKAPTAPQPPKPQPAPQASKPAATPAPAPKAPAAPVPPKPQAPAAPTQPQPNPTPAPAPVAPKPVPTPPPVPNAPAVPQPPKPQPAQAPAPAVPEAPKLTPTPQPQADAPAPAWLKPTTPAPQAAQTPAQTPTTPTPPPVAVPAPVAPTPPATPAPQPIPPATPAPATPSAPVESKPLEEGKDEPIAIIRAESLTPQQPQNPSQS